MSVDFKKVFKIACVYTGTILGAGFASGKEIAGFFVKYGYFGIAGLIFAGMLFAFIGAKIMKITFENNINTYSEFADRIFGRYFGLIMQTIVFVFLFTLFSAMIAGGGAVIKQTFGISAQIGSLIIALFCFFIFIFDVDGIVELNVFLCPVLVIGGAFIGLYIFFSHNSPVFNYGLLGIGSFFDNWFTSAFIYVSYNIISASAVLISLRPVIESKKTAVMGGAAGGAVMAFLGICIFLPLLVNYSRIKGIDIPMLFLTDEFGKFMSFVYFAVFISAVITTAAGNGFAVIKWVSENTKLEIIYVKALIVLAGFTASLIGFSGFVEKIYPLFGVIGIVELFIIALTVSKKHY